MFGDGSDYLLSALRSSLRCVRICSICARSSEVAVGVFALLAVDPLVPVDPAAADDPFRIASIASM